MILVTGCGSAEGLSIIKDLKANKHEVRCQDLYRPRGIPDGIEVITGLLDSDRDMDHALKGVNTIIHLLEVKDQWQKGRAYMKKINLDFSRRLLSAAAASGVKHAIIRSSWQVYGSTGKDPVNETCPMQPVSALGKDKRMLEIFCSSQAISPMKITILRTALTVGPHTDNPGTLLMLYLSLAQKNNNKTTIIHGGSNVFELLDIRDLTAAVSTALEKQTPGVFNLSGGGKPTSASLIEIIKQFEPGVAVADISSFKARITSFFLGGLFRLHYLAGEHLMMLTQDSAMDTSAARKALNWEPKHDSASALTDTIKWYREFKLSSVPAGKACV